MVRLGKPLPKMPGLRRVGQPERPRGIAKTTVPRSASYQKILEEVARALAQLPVQDRQRIPATATLPEQIVGLVLCWLGYYFQAQSHEDGGRLFLGGSVVDFKVWMGAQVIIIRVQGDYWHSLPGRRHKDQVQWERLHRQGYRVWDAWEKDLYTAWFEGRIRQFIDEGVRGAV